MNTDQLNRTADNIENLAARAERGDSAAHRMLNDAFDKVQGGDLISLNRKLNQDLNGHGNGASIDIDATGTPTSITFFPSITDRAIGAVMGHPARNVTVALHDKNICINKQHC